MHLHLSSRVPLVDHTTGESLRYFLEEFSGQDQSPTLVIEGWDHMRGLCPITRRARASPTHSSLSSHQVPAPCSQGDRHGAGCGPGNLRPPGRSTRSVQMAKAGATYVSSAK